MRIGIVCRWQDKCAAMAFRKPEARVVTERMAVFTNTNSTTNNPIFSRYHLLLLLATTGIRSNTLQKITIQHLINFLRGAKFYTHIYTLRMPPQFPPPTSYRMMLGIRHLLDAHPANMDRWNWVTIYTLLLSLAVSLCRCASRRIKYNPLKNIAMLSSSWGVLLIVPFAWPHPFGLSLTIRSITQ